MHQDGSETRLCEECGDEEARTGGRFCSKRCRQREYRRRTGNAATRRYERTPRGFLMRKYRNMKSRVKGISRAGSWTGKSLLSKEEFYRWALNEVSFWRLYKTWVRSDYDRRLTPSVNRIDPDGGYTLDNMEWITHSVNSALSSMQRKEHEAVRRLALER